MIARFLAERLRAGLAHFPAVLLTGARQVGKSTLARSLIGEAWPARYLTLDDHLVLAAARRDPQGLIEGLDGPAVLDEVQRAPELLRAVKLAVDRDRRPGRFLLTGSANLRLMRTVSETLAGRVAVLELYPFSWAETLGRPLPPTIPLLFSCTTAAEFLGHWPARAAASRHDYAAAILRGGYPPACLAPDETVRAEWFYSYRQTYIERDVRDLARLEHLPEFARLLVALAASTGRLLNAAELARDLGMSLTTLRRHLALLHLTYQTLLVRPYHASPLKRTVKAPRIYLSDTGFACHLAGIDRWENAERQGRTGQLVETWVATELTKLVAASDPRVELYFWRTYEGREVDFLLARGERLAAVEVKWSSSLDRSALRGVEALRAALGARLGLAVVLYAGQEALALDAGTAAVPFSLFLGAE